MQLSIFAQLYSVIIRFDAKALSIGQCMLKTRCWLGNSAFFFNLMNVCRKPLFLQVRNDFSRSEGLQCCH